MAKDLEPFESLACSPKYHVIQVDVLSVKYPSAGKHERFSAFVSTCMAFEHSQRFMGLCRPLQLALQRWLRVQTGSYSRCGGNWVAKRLEPPNHVPQRSMQGTRHSWTPQVCSRIGFWAIIIRTLGVQVRA